MCIWSLDLKYISLRVDLYLNRSDSKNSKNKQVKIPLRETKFPFIKIIIEFKISHVCYVLADVNQMIMGSYEWNLIYLKWRLKHFYSNLQSSFLRCGTRPKEWGAQ